MTTSSNQRTMTVERFAWITAYIGYFEQERTPAVLEALGVAQQEFNAAAREHNRRMAEALVKGNSVAAKQFADELVIARMKLKEDKPTLEDVRAMYATKARQLEAAARASTPSAPPPTAQSKADALPNPDETVMMRAYLPNVVLPFQRGSEPKPPAPASPPSRTPDLEGGSTVLAPIPVLPKPALPFASPPPAPPSQVKPGFESEDTLPVPPPPKKS
ncbi:MAG: hypothetical protein HOW73_41060 [Polyangiaceae bacterium]|nr:hypothetical protein [Polyangiaceae bacterium]